MFLESLTERHRIPEQPHRQCEEIALTPLTPDAVGAYLAGRFPGVTLPPELGPGDYTLSLRDWEGFLAEEMRTRSFRFQSSNVDELFAVIGEFVNVQRAALYLRLVRDKPGVAVGRVPLGRLPPSRAQLLNAAGRNDVSSFLDMPTRSQPTELVLSGSADLSLTVEAAPVAGR